MVDNINSSNNSQLNSQLNNQALNSFDSELIQLNVPLKDKIWFRTGGPAKYFCEPQNAQEFKYALNFAKINNLEIFVLGQGANVLVSDDGFEGLVIRPKINLMELLDPSIQNSVGISLGTSGSYSNNISTVDTNKTEEINKENLSPHRSSRVFFESEAEKNVSRDVADQAFVKSGSGVVFQELIDFCLKNNLVGLEEFSGIPGTVGGSVFINIHYFEFLLSQFLESAEIINKESGEILTVDKSWFNFGYNYSQLHEEKYYLISATFKLKKVTELEAAYSSGRSFEISRQRSKKYPVVNTCGSFFRNFYDNEVSLESNNKKLIYVAYYLDKIGVKGTLSIGDAIVSYQHANMIVNRGNATSSDIINLVKTMQQLVKEKYNITPQPECRLIGFKEYPLLK